MEFLQSERGDRREKGRGLPGGCRPPGSLEVFGFIFCPMGKGQSRGDAVVNYKHLYIKMNVLAAYKASFRTLR